MLTIQTAKDPKFVTAREQNLLKSLHDRRVLTLIVEAASSCNLNAPSATPIPVGRRSSRSMPVS